MFCELPADIQHSIYQKLDVFDRTKLNMALPKASKINCDKVRDKKLGVVVKAIQKKRVSSLSCHVKLFLKNLPKDDVTHEIVKESFPDVYSREVDKDTIVLLIQNARCEKEFAEIEEFISGDSDARGKLFYCCLYNLDLFEFIAKRAKIDIELMRPSLKYCLISPRYVDMIVEHFKPSAEELEAFYIYCINDMKIDVALYIDDLLCVYKNAQATVQEPICGCT